jgi:hypothetical protein
MRQAPLCLHQMDYLFSEAPMKMDHQKTNWVLAESKMTVELMETQWMTACPSK